ncbi:10865_t:CDS:10 [Ambispora leptoticha]|uniref:10865_t:CDS:1 n=1 Tax=Ambispora leptoticha TaxID=144679 RepID=A0A9N8VDH7_9GLOM|nr:10865_t:CDS:10 [Ambispora leptoticha]
MISSLHWVRKGVAAEQPEKYELTEQEYERINVLTAGELKEAREELKEIKEEQMNDVKKEEDPELAEYNLENYDDDDEEKIEGRPIKFFGSVKSLTYYASNEEDPYLTLNDEEDGSEAEDLRILKTDNLLVAAKTEDEISQLEIYVYEESNDNLYVHHDIMLPSFPLCLEWLDFRLGRKSDVPGGGNYIAVGTFEPEIEIWDLDTMESMYPDAIIGNREVKGGGKKKREKKINPNYHTDAVMSLAWNKQHRNILASSSADTTVKLWDLQKFICAHSFNHHSDKVQQVQWHPIESTILITASYDKTVTAFDSRSPQAIETWNISSDPECIQWNPFSPQQFYVSTEEGLVLCFDARNTGNDNNKNHHPLFTLHAHDSSVSALDVNPLIEGCLVTGSPDKTVKVWDVKSLKPNMVTSRDLSVGKVFSLQFCPDSPFQLAVAGSSGSVYIWDISTNAGVRHVFEGRGIPLGTSKIPVKDIDTQQYNNSVN